MPGKPLPILIPSLRSGFRIHKYVTKIITKFRIRKMKQNVAVCKEFDG